MENATPHGVSDEWNTIPWQKLARYVYRLQKRIYKAKQRSDTRAVRGLNRMLIRSKAAKTLAVRQVAYSTPKLPPIPGESCHRFHGKAATCSTPKLPLIP